MRIDPLKLRKKLGMNQTDFWTPIGVTQTAGSRYESDDPEQRREMPKPVLELLRVIYVEKIDLSQIKRGDAELISYLRRANPTLYKNLRRAARDFVNKNKEKE